MLNVKEVNYWVVILGLHAVTCLAGRSKNEKYIFDFLAATRFTNQIKNLKKNTNQKLFRSLWSSTHHLSRGKKKTRMNQFLVVGKQCLSIIFFLLTLDNSSKLTVKYPLALIIICSWRICNKNSCNILQKSVSPIEFTLICFKIFSVAKAYKRKGGFNHAHVEFNE